tara:strand:+ start:287 stop:622 length:336 start_codon:yes stop_codon:yes gene_type:complete
MTATNNYLSFLELADDEHNLQDLVEAFNRSGFEGTPMEGIPPEGVVNDQYEIIQSGSSTIVLDKYNDTKIFVSGNGLTHFLQAAENQIEERCGGLDYHSWQHMQHSINKDD